MKSLCVICDIGHASPRIPGLMTELSKLGWRVDILTPKLTQRQRELFLDSHFRGFTLIEDPKFRCLYKIEYGQPVFIKFLFRLRRKLRKRINLLLSKWDPAYLNTGLNMSGVEDHAGWVQTALRVFDDSNALNKYDAILTSSSPFTAHIIGHRISSLYNIPWMADYRDLWNMNHATAEDAHSKEKLEFEKLVLSKSAKMITVSEYLANQLGNFLGREPSVVYNGYYDVEFKSSQVKDGPKEFIIAYTGSIFPKYMEYKAWVEACLEVLSPDSPVKFLYSGRGNGEIDSILKTSNSVNAENFQNLGFLSHEETLRLQKSADALLLFGWDDSNMLGCLQTKFYEYMAARKPILLFGGNRNDECAAILREIGGYLELNSKEDAIFFLKSPTQQIAKMEPRNLNSQRFSYTYQGAKLSDHLLDMCLNATK